MSVLLSSQRTGPQNVLSLLYWGFAGLSIGGNRNIRFSLHIDFCEVISMNSCELVMAISALACCIAEGKSSDQIAFISSVFSQLGDTLATIAAQRDLSSPWDD